MKIKSDYSNEPQWKEVNVKSTLPKELACLDELAHLLELGDNFLGRYAYLFSKLVYSRLSQIFSYPGPHRNRCGL